LLSANPAEAGLNGKRLAVAITAMFEAWSDGKGPPHLVQRIRWALAQPQDEIAYAQWFFAQ